MIHEKDVKIVDTSDRRANDIRFWKLAEGLEDMQTFEYIYKKPSAIAFWRLIGNAEYKTELIHPSEDEDPQDGIARIELKIALFSDPFMGPTFISRYENELEIRTDEEGLTNVTTSGLTLAPADLLIRRLATKHLNFGSMNFSGNDLDLYAP